MAKFACVINCIDGQVQNVVHNYMLHKHDVDYVDTVTAAGVAKVLAENKKEEIIKNIRFRTSVSVEKHGSDVVVVAGHFDCSMITRSDQEQKQMILEAVQTVKSWDFSAQVYGIFVHEDLTIEEL